jgi:hypothetical protein
LDFWFADDARQKKPSRHGVGELIGVGGVRVSAAKVADFEHDLEVVCGSYGLRREDRFKWSPTKKQVDAAMRSLAGDRRTQFFVKLLSVARKFDARAVVVIEDVTRDKADKRTATHEEDVTALFLERIEQTRSHAVVVASSGDGNLNYLGKCAPLLASGTEFIRFTGLPLGVMTAPSSQARALQLADLIVSSTTSRVAGESQFSRPVFEALRPLLLSDGSRVGGVGLKLHPDYCFANLYHWLVGDQYLMKGGTGHPLPIAGRQFASNAGEADSGL